MATGLFPVRDDRRGGPRKGYRPKNRRGKLDAFAEALADSGNVAIASAAVGISKASGDTYLSRIRKKLGWQAQ